MVKHFIKNIMNLIYLFPRLFLPKSLLKFYPPTYVIRDPQVEWVDSIFKSGSQAAIIVFKVSYSNFEKYDLTMEQFKHILKASIRNAIPLNIILNLEQTDVEHLSLLIKIDDNRNYLSEIERYIENVNKQLEEHIINVNDVVKNGYMFIDQENKSRKAAIQFAFFQAIAVSEKRLKSEYNDLLLNMRKIIQNNEIHLFAQPIIDIASGQVKAYEMLTRGPANTDLENPLNLFSLAKQTNLLYELEKLVFENVLKKVIETRCSHSIFINFTPMTLGNIQFINDIEMILKKYPQIISKKLIIEITERESIDDLKYILSNIRSARELGFRIAVDDTGAGYASLNMISVVMPDIIKIDRSVIQDIDKNRVKESMLQGLLHIAKEAGSKVVAEGIETKGEASILLKNKVDLAQGYYYGRPAISEKIM